MIPQNSPHVSRAGTTSVVERRSESTFVWLSWICYVVVVVAVVLQHEPWRDELQAWRLAIDSSSWSDLAFNARHEGHPLLWHGLLHLVGLVSRSWWAVVVLHTGIACATAWLILRYAPFPRWQRVVAIFGYYFAYEYAVVARSYGPGVFLAFAAVTVWTRPKRRVWLASVLLLLLANTSAHGLILACALALGFFVDWAWSGAVVRSRNTIVRRGALVVATMLVTSVLIYRFASQSSEAYEKRGTSNGRLTKWSVAMALTTPAQGAVPLATRSLDGKRWIPGVIHPVSTSELFFFDLLSLGLLTAAMLTAARRWIGVVSMIAGSGALLLFALLFLIGAPRHNGHFVVMWLLSYWLSESKRDDAQIVRSSARHRRFSGLAFASMHVPLLLASLQYWRAEWSLPFSDAKRVAEVLQRPPYLGIPLIAGAPAEGMAVAALTPAPVFLAGEGRYAAFNTWGYIDPSVPRVSGQAIREAEAVKRAIKRQLRSHCEVIVISSADRPLPAPLPTLGEETFRTAYLTIVGEGFVLTRFRAKERAECTVQTQKAVGIK